MYYPSFLPESGCRREAVRPVGERLRSADPHSGLRDGDSTAATSATTTASSSSGFSGMNTESCGCIVRRRIEMTMQCLSLEVLMRLQMYWVHGWSIWILHWKLKYLTCCLRDLRKKFGRRSAKQNIYST